jgi:DsbC/DsbD-like thiol-disulfide interchange protein
VKRVDREVRIATRLALALFALNAAAIAAAAAEKVASDWFQGFNNKARLLAGRAVRDDEPGIYAGVEIEMPEGWKTYWRSPGDAGGVPPEFDWQGSENLAGTQVLYPAPHRLRDKAGDVVGYKDHVLFPVAVTPKDASKPVILHGKVAYGVCKDICIPAEVELQIAIPHDIATSDTLNNVLARVPRPHARPGVDPLLAAWHLDQTTGKPKLVLSVETASPGGIDAFVEAPAGVYVPLPKHVADAAGKAVFEVDLTDGVDIKDLKGKPLTVTMIDDKGQSETTITLE